MKTQFKNQILTVWESQYYRTTTSYVDLGTTCILVDPNLTEDEILSIRSFVHQRHLPQNVTLIFTHSDYDHIAGYPYFNEAKTIGSYLFEEENQKVKAMSELIKFDQENNIIRSTNYEFPSLDLKINHDTQTVSSRRDELIFFQIPGHTKDSIAVVSPQHQILVVGDYLSNIEIPWINDSIQSYLETLKRLEQIIFEFQITICVPGHGDIMLNQNEIIERIQSSKEYLLELQRSMISKEVMDIESWCSRYPDPEAIQLIHKENLGSIEE